MPTLARPLDARRNAAFGEGLARAFAGAVIFGLPLLMTMEMWWLGFYMPAWKLGLLLVLFFPFLVALSWHAGFEPTFSWRDDVVDALVAYAVGFLASAAVLALLDVLERQMALREAVGAVSLQAVPASVGALLAQTQLGQRETEQATRGGNTRYASELFVMAVGALFLAFNLAPTEEMVLIALRITPGQAMVLVLFSLACMHAFVYGMAFRGRRHEARGRSLRSLFLRFTVTGYVLALLLSAYMLWSFGRLDGLSPLNGLMAAVVLGFPAAIGAAAARLIL